MNPIERRQHNTRRLAEAERWAAFVLDHPTPEWSRLQAELIDSQLENALQVGLTAQQVKDIKSAQTGVKNQG